MKKIVSLLLAGLLLALTACTAVPTKTSVTTTPPQEHSDEPEDSHLLYNQDYLLDFGTYLTVPTLNALKLTMADLNANWEAMAAQITSTYATYSDAPEGYEAVKGDKLSIHYKGYAAEGNTISAATLLNMQNIQNGDGSAIDPSDLVLGSNSMIGAYESAEHPEKNNAGFEDQLIGMKAGETRTITVTFPDEYGNSDELRGMVTHFDVTVYSIKIGSTPQLSDDLVATYTQNTYTTIAALQEYVLDYYKGQVAYSALEGATIFHKLPDELVDKEITQYVYEYIEYTHPGEALSDEETKVIFDEQYNNAKAYAEKLVKAKLILEALFARYEITLTWGEYKEMRAAYFEQDYYMYYMYYGITTEEEYEDFIGADTMIQQCKYEKLLKILKAEAVFE